MLRPLTRRQILVDIAISGATFVLFAIWAGIFGIGGLLLLAGYCVALIMRRLRPGIALGIAWVVSVLQMVATLDPNPINLIVLGVLYATSAYGSKAERWWGFASSIIAAVVIALYVVGIPALQEGLAGGFSTGLAVRTALSGAFLLGAALAGFLLAWTAGLLMRTWMSARASSAAASVAEREVVAEQERTRIARDMHDVVAHSLAVVIAQADGARYLRKTDPEAVDGALETIASTSREALADVRVLLAQLRHSQGDAPQPVLADLERLYEQLRASGLDIGEEASGEPLNLGTSAQLAVYRIVQESLTNALRHGDRERPVVVRFDWAPGGLHLSVTSALPAAPPAPSAGSGHGVDGMTERAIIVGGNLTAAADGDRFVVRAWLPAVDRATAERIAP